MAASTVPLRSSIALGFPLGFRNANTGPCHPLTAQNPVVGSVAQRGCECCLSTLQALCLSWQKQLPMTDLYLIGREFSQYQASSATPRPVQLPMAIILRACVPGRMSGYPPYSLPLPSQV